MIFFVGTKRWEIFAGQTLPDAVNSKGMISMPLLIRMKILLFFHPTKEMTTWDGVICIIVCAKMAPGCRRYILEMESILLRWIIHPLSVRIINIFSLPVKGIDTISFPKSKISSGNQKDLNSYGNGNDDIYIMNFKAWRN